MTKQQKTVLFVSIFATFVSFFDGTVINIALPAIEAELGGGLMVQQWVTNAYMLSLGALMLLAGSLSDVFSRKRILIIGLVGFAITSLLCALAPSSLLLILARGLQGAAGALIVPSSLALIISHFSGPAQGKAIGTWTAWTSVAVLIGPLIGGFIVDVSSWRLIFAINVIPIVITLWLMRKLAAETRDLSKVNRIDIGGAVLGVAGLTGVVYGLIEQAYQGWANPWVISSIIIGVLLLVLFIYYEKHTKQPMVPLTLFKNQNFSAGNVATVFIYAALSLSAFSIAIFVQQIGGFSAIEAGFVMLPTTIIMFLFSSKVGKLAGKYGTKWFMAGGPLLAGVGFLTMLDVEETVNYWTQLFPGVLLFSIGLTLTVSPLTSTVLGSINSAQAGIGSAINNAVSRVAGLIAVAAIGAITGPTLSVSGFHRTVVTMAILMFLAAVVSAVWVKNNLFNSEQKS